MENERKLDPIYCCHCKIVIEFIPRDEKLRHVGKIVECKTCGKKYIVNEGRYFLLEYES